jgi:adenylate cyclase
MTRETSEEARTLLERAIALDPGHAAAHAMLAHVHQLDYINQWSDDPKRSAEVAFDLARRAVDLDDSEPWAHWVLGMVHAHRKEYPEAVAEIERSLALDPNFAAGYGALGMSRLWQGEPEQALEAFAAGARLDPHYPDIMLHMTARAHFLLGEYERACDLLHQRIARNPATDISRVLLASCRGHLGQIDAARAAWAEAFRVNPAYSLEHRRELLPAREYVLMLEGLWKAGLVER